MESEKLYYIRNRGFIGNALLWWRANSKGYTSDIEDAGKYTEEQAKNICKRPEDSAFSCEYIDNIHQARKVIVDAQYVDYEQEQFKDLDNG